MGVPLSCPFAILSDLDQSLVSILDKSTSLKNDDQSIQVDWKCNEVECPPISPVVDECHPEHEAAIKLQKVYKSFRTRRKLADCAVLIEQNWWKLIDFVELKHSSISFFDLDKHETAISRWSRARTRAAKVGKGLSKNGKARKLALQHWLEAIDPRHRYGHNLHFYYVRWLHSQSKEPFFYWLDIGEGREIDLVDKCPRSKLQQQCIKYLGPMERNAYEVAVEDGKLLYKKSGDFLDTTGGPKGSKWIFVLSTSKVLYVGKKKKGTFQHSSFLAGGATLAAGRIVVEQGHLKAVWPHSGHYRPTPENFQDLIAFLTESNIDLTNVKLDAIDDEDEDSICNKDGLYLRSNSEDDLTEKECHENGISSTEKMTPSALEVLRSKPSRIFSKGLSDLEIPSKVHLLERLRSEIRADGHNLDDSLSDTDEPSISGKCVLQRIHSRQGLQSFQLGRQLSCKWSTGAGPRIGCVRDYPTGLQSHALEQVNLSPRSIHRLRLDLPSRPSTPTSFSYETQEPLVMSPGMLSSRIGNHYRIQPSPLCQDILTVSALDRPSFTGRRQA